MRMFSSCLLGRLGLGRSGTIPTPVLKSGNNCVKLLDSSLKLTYGVGGQLFRFGQFVHIVERFVFEPLQGIDLVILCLDFLNRERPPAILLGVSGLSFGAAVRVGSITLFELLEVFRRERAVFFRDMRYIGASVIYPGHFGGLTFSEKNDVRLSAGTIRAECAIREAQHCMQLAVLH